MLSAVILIAALGALAFAQPKASAPRLPSAEKIVDAYLRTIGGRKRVAAIRDATYEWEIHLQDQSLGVAKTQMKFPGSTRSELTFGNGQIIFGANPRSSWIFGLDGKVHTRTDDEAETARLQAVLEAGRFLNLKKGNVLARSVSLKTTDSGAAYVVEFSTKSGARVRYLFSPSTKLVLGVEHDSPPTVTYFDDYRAEGNVLEPHRMAVNIRNSGLLTFTLKRTSYNTGLADVLFDPPKPDTALDVVSLLREVERNQDQIEQRFHEYAFRKKETDREIGSKGEIKKETTKVFEVFPIANRRPVMKLISENGVALTAERAAKEQKRVEEEFAKAERDKEKDERRVQKYREERERKRADGKDDDDDGITISQFLKIHEFVSPRREKFRDREVVVFDFRPRSGFKSSNRQEDLISKLIGVAWVDPVDKQIMRLEARLAEGFKMGGGLFVNLKPGAAFVMEQTRMAEGVWLPRLAQINLSARIFLFAGADLNKTIEWSDYKHFAGDVGDYKLEGPAKPEQMPKKQL